MAGYTADAYNTATPTSEQIAGYMDLELQALKTRLNAQIGLAAVVDVGTRLSAVETRTTDANSGNAALLTKIQANTEAIAGHSTLLTSHATAINSLNSAVTSQGNTITSQGNTLTSLNGTVTAQGTTIASHTASITSINGSISTLNQAVTNANNNITYVDNRVTTLTNAENAKPTIIAGTTAPNNAWGKDGDLYVMYV